ncbi:hypothetical protein [Neptunicoccus cionae]|uniref:hypothetical protein n=1 Tax=Neptunicoccus cionae TaxID=2035344 RepID=UPI000C76AE0A|nr:hypothetical protein [Amylibacter cionae]PLS20953.1 hypothetical protein C0U40_15225 [Amylibacter cionae]
MAAKTGLTATTVVRTVKAERLATNSSLYELGSPDGATSDESFILKLNTLVGSRQLGYPKGTPADIASAVSENGILHPAAELVAFGKWLMIDEPPELISKGGKKPDPRTVLKCTGTCLLERHFRYQKDKKGLKNNGRENRTKGITKHDVSLRWNKLFEDTTKASDFDARLKSELLPICRTGSGVN